jgi:hypothetical protein
MITIDSEINIVYTFTLLFTITTWRKSCVVPLQKPKQVSQYVLLFFHSFVLTHGHPFDCFHDLIYFEIY